MFPLLLKIRLLSARNVVLETLRRHFAWAVGLSILSLGLFGAVFSGFLFFFRVASHLPTANFNALHETVYQILYFLFLFLLAGAVPFVASTLLHSSDYTLLFASPIPARAVVAAKLLDATVTNSLQFAILGIPAIVACAFALDLSFWGWLLVPLLIGLFALLPALLTALGLLLLLALVGMKRMRSAITLLNAVMAVGVCLTIVLEAGHLPIKPGGSSALFTGQAGQMIAVSSTAHVVPSGWFAECLLALGGVGGGTIALAALGKIALICLVLYAACLLLGAKLLSAANVAEENEGGKVAGGTEGIRLLRGLFSPPIAGMIAKDFKYLWRDSVLLSQLSMPLILFFVPFVLGLQDTAREIHAELYPFALIMIGVILFMQTSILSLSCLGLESRSFWAALVSPNSGGTLLKAKFAMSVLTSASVSLLLTLTAALAFGVSWKAALLEGIVVLCSASGLCGLGVGISAAFPRFLYDNPAHRVSAWALILGFFASTAYVILSGLILGGAWLLASQEGLEKQSPIFYGVSAACYLLLTLSVILIPMAIGARRIERYEWEH